MDGGDFRGELVAEGLFVTLVYAAIILIILIRGGGLKGLDRDCGPWIGCTFLWVVLGVFLGLHRLRETLLSRDLSGSIRRGVLTTCLSRILKLKSSVISRLH